MKEKNLEKYVSLIGKAGRIKDSKKKKTCLMINNDALFLIMNQKYLTARELAKKYNYEIVVVSNKKDANRECITDAYGFGQYVLQKGNIFALAKTLCGVIVFLLKNTPSKLPEAEYRGVLIGDLIYDSVIMQSKDSFTIHNLFNKKMIFECARAILMVHEIETIFKKYNVEMLIAQDLVYHDAIYSRYANAKGAKTIVLTTGRPSFVFEPGGQASAMNYDRIYAANIEKEIAKLSDNWLQGVEERLAALLKGDGDWNTALAYKDKVILPREKVLKEMGIENNKKNVVIMAHCFSDAPHRNMPMLYQDYYVWLEETLKITQENNQVNWILKPHPSREHYGESGSVEELFEKYKHDNLYLMPDKFSTVVIKEIADVIVTVNGSAGMELSCLGIPCVNAGTPYYAYFNYTHIPQSKEEYYKLLKNAEKIEKLNEEQIITAKKVFGSFYKIILNKEDEFAQKSYMIHQKYVKNGDVDEANADFLELLEETMESGSLESIYDIQFINDYMKKNYNE